MEIKTTTDQSALSRFLLNFSLVLIGTLVTAIIFAHLVTALGEWGIWLSIFISGFLAFAGFYWGQKGTKLRLITWGLTITLVLGIIAFIVGLSLVSEMLKDL